MSERVSIEIKDGIADVRLNRPERMNAIDAAMFNGLVAAGRKLAEDASVRVVVLSGEGRAFCAGLDFSSFQAMEGSERDENVESAFGRDGESPANAGQRAAFIWQELPMPVIAAVHGPAFGGGLQIALGADIRYVRPDAQLSVMEIKWETRSQAPSLPHRPPKPNRSRKSKPGPPRPKLRRPHLAANQEVKIGDGGS